MTFDAAFFFVIGIAATMGLGFTVKPFLALVRKRIRVPKISNDREIQGAWEQLITHPEVSGQWVGHLERVIFFGALFLEPKEAIGAIGAWIAFKVAAKWEAWNHMGYVPDKLDKVEPLTFATARRIWAAQGYATLVLGTGANLLLAAAGAAIAKFAPTALAGP